MAQEEFPLHRGTLLAEVALLSPIPDALPTLGIRGGKGCSGDMLGIGCLILHLCKVKLELLPCPNLCCVGDLGSGSCNQLPELSDHHCTQASLGWNGKSAPTSPETMTRPITQDRFTFTWGKDTKAKPQLGVQRHYTMISFWASIMRELDKSSHPVFTSVQDYIWVYIFRDNSSSAPISLVNSVNLSN